MRISFEVMTTELKGLQCEIDRESVSIGRSAGNDLVLDQHSVSRRHARITSEDNLLLLEDLGSKNSTKLRGQELKGPVPLADGDVVSFGEVAVRISLPAGKGADTPDNEVTPFMPELALQGQALPKEAGPRPPAIAEERLPRGPAAPAPTGLAAGAPGEGARGQWLAIVLALIATCALAAYFIAEGSVGPEPLREYAMTVRVGQKKVVMVPRGFVHRPEFEDEGLLKVERPMNLDRAVLLIGLSEGFTSVNLYDEEGRFITFQTKVLPRRRPQAAALLEDQPMTDEERIRRAVKLLKQGDRLREESEPYRAMQHYDQALSVLEPFARRPNTEYLQAKRRYDVVQQEIDARFERLTREMGDFIKVGDKRTALRRLTEIQELIPDSEDVRRQNADLLFRLLEAAITKEQQSEGRAR